MRVSNKLFYVFILTLLNIIWGGTYVATSIAMLKIKPITLAFLRFLVASLVMIPILIFKYRFVKLSLKDLLLCINLGLIGFTLTYIFQNIGIKYTTSINAAIEISSEPIMMIVLAVLFLNEKLNLNIVLGVIFSTIGVLMIILSSNSESISVSNLHYSILGDIFVLLSAFFCAIYTILGSKVIKRIPSFVVTTYAVISGTILLFPIALFYENGLSDILNIDFKTLIAVLYLAILATSFAYFVWYLLLTKLDASFMGNFLNIQPIVGMIAGNLILDEVIYFKMIIGTTLIILGIYITSNSKLNDKGEEIDILSIDKKN